MHELDGQLFNSDCEGNGDWGIRIEGKKEMSCLNALTVRFNIEPILSVIGLINLT